MADRPATLTQPLTRAQITEMIGGNPRLVRWFEGVVRDVTEVLTNAAFANSTAAEAAQVTANAARIVADEAVALVDEAAQGADTAMALAQSGLSEIDRLWAAVGAGGGHLIEDEGVALTQRSTLNFTGSGVSVADSGGKTVVTINGGGGGGNSYFPGGF